MRMNSLSLWTCLLVVGLTACGGGSSSSNSAGGDESPQLTSVSDLPQATGPVEGASASLSLASGDAAFLATTGMGLGVTNTDDFDSDTSLAACEMFNQTKSAIQSAAQADLILCYITSTFDAYIEQTDSSINIYDGAYHTFALDFSGADMGEEGDGGGEGEGEGEGGPDLIKFKISKDADGGIIGFEMFACSEGAQNEYISQVIDGATFSMTAKGNHSRGENSNTFETVVNGTLNANNKFTGTKSIVQKFNGTFGDSTNWGVMTFNQGTDQASLAGYMSGSFSGNMGAGTFTNQIQGVMQILDSNVDGDPYDIGLVALGDGAVIGHTEGSNDQDSWTHDFTEGWLGDTRLEDSESPFLTDLADATLEDQTEPELGFSGAEVFDCSGTPELTIRFADIMGSGEGDDIGQEGEPVRLFQSCSNLELTHNWINCWEKQEGQDQGGDQQGGGQGPQTCNVDADCSNLSGTICFQGGQEKICAMPCDEQADCSSIPNAVCHIQAGVCGPNNGGGGN